MLVLLRNWKRTANGGFLMTAGDVLFIFGMWFLIIVGFWLSMTIPMERHSRRMHLALATLFILLNWMVTYVAWNGEVLSDKLLLGVALVAPVVAIAVSLYQRHKKSKKSFFIIAIAMCCYGTTWFMALNRQWLVSFFMIFGFVSLCFIFLHNQEDEGELGRDKSDKEIANDRLNENGAWTFSMITLFLFLLMCVDSVLQGAV